MENQGLSLFTGTLFSDQLQTDLCQTIRKVQSSQSTFKEEDIMDELCEQKV